MVERGGWERGRESSGGERTPLIPPCVVAAVDRKGKSARGAVLLHRAVTGRADCAE